MVPLNIPKGKEEPPQVSKELALFPYCSPDDILTPSKQNRYQIEAGATTLISSVSVKRLFNTPQGGKGVLGLFIHTAA